MMWTFRFVHHSKTLGEDATRLIGAKAARLAELAAMGLPVPPNFTLTTEACVYFNQHGQSFPPQLKEQVLRELRHVEMASGKRFGDPINPLLLAVRPSGCIRIPWLTDSVLNLGLNDEAADGLAKLSGDRRFAFDTYRRFIQQYSTAVLGLDQWMFEEIIHNQTGRQAINSATEFTAHDLELVVSAYKHAIEGELGRPFPQDPREQLWSTISAVFSGWMNDRAKSYRNRHNIQDGWGTAVNIQAMVFGNMNGASGAGAAFTRDPTTGDDRLCGEFLTNAQAEDIVDGGRTPRPLTKAACEGKDDVLSSMEEAFPEIFEQLRNALAMLEARYRDMQDVDFTFERGRLFILSARSAKRTTKAAVKVAFDFARDGVISQLEAVRRIDPASVGQLLQRTIAKTSSEDLIAVGLPASPGVATGKLAFSEGEVRRARQTGDDVILVCVEISRDDIPAIDAAKGLVTTRGGMTSHAAVAARARRRPCVSGRARYILIGLRAGCSHADRRFLWVKASRSTVVLVQFSPV